MLLGGKTRRGSISICWPRAFAFGCLFHLLFWIIVPTSLLTSHHSSQPTMPPKGGSRQPQLRACLVCSILQPLKDFVETGCPNCEDVVGVCLLILSR